MLKMDKWRRRIVGQEEKKEINTISILNKITKAIMAKSSLVKRHLKKFNETCKYGICESCRIPKIRKK